MQADLYNAKMWNRTFAPPSEGQVRLPAWLGSSIAQMLTRFAKHYARRVVNVNVNILVAGFLALLPTVIIVHFVTSMGPNGEASWAIRQAQWLGVQKELIINVVTFVSDLIFDIAILYSLHYLANHWPRAWHLRHKDRGKPHLTYWADATLVQMERMVLSPLMYGLFLGTQHILLHQGVDPIWATVAGYIAGGAATRSLHTLWMMRCERKQNELLSKASTAAAQTPASTLEPSSMDLKPGAVTGGSNGSNSADQQARPQERVGSV